MSDDLSWTRTILLHFQPVEIPLQCPFRSDKYTGTSIISLNKIEMNTADGIRIVLEQNLRETVGFETDRSRGKMLSRDELCGTSIP